MFPAHYASHFMRKKPRHLIVHVTGRCNYRCGHCFVDFRNGNDLPLEAYRLLARQAGKLFWLDIGGGEPFLREDLADIVAAFKARVITVSSNGAFAHSIVRQLREIRARTQAELCVSLSVDGLEATHDRIRNAPGSWKTVWEAYRLIRRIENISVKINTVLCNENYGEISELARDVKRRAPDFHSVILHRGTPRNDRIRLPSLELLENLTPDLFKVWSLYDYGKGPVSSYLLRNYHRYLWRISLESLKLQRQIIPCLAGQTHMVVEADGGVSSCELLPRLGSLTTQTWNEILAGGGLKDRVRFIRERQCSCTHNCVMLDNILFNPGSVLHLLRQRGARCK